MRESFEERMVRLRPTERLPQDPEVEAAKPRLEPVGVRARQAPLDHHEPGLRSGLNISLIVSKLREARSRLYRRQILQVNIRWKALDEIYKMHIPLHRSDLKIPATKSS